MEGTLFNYKMFLKNCISHIISMKYIMNSITGCFQLSHCQTREITSATIYQTGFPAFTVPAFTCISESMKVSSRVAPRDTVVKVIKCYLKHVAQHINIHGDIAGHLLLL
ncbi:hypothetical protein AMTRI_Chr10g2320 [Amborella trichopoda]